NERLQSFNRLYKMWVALEVTPWPMGQVLRNELRTWLRPRIKVAWAERRLVDAVREPTSPTGTPARQNRDRWLQFVDGDLGRALRQYDGASTVALRLEALNRVYGALGALQQTNASHAWVHSQTLEETLNDLYNHPNLDVSADVATLEPVLSNDVVKDGS